MDFHFITKTSKAVMDTTKSIPIEVPAAAATMSTTAATATKHNFLSLSPSRSSPSKAAASAPPSNPSASSDASGPSLNREWSNSTSETIEPLENARKRAGSSGSIGGSTFLLLGPIEEY
ncbi:hypothetical protein K431DRAFT_73437 [Polychaeton citri CBS 116435]|uniref:Uncharacterized protein n=1 Tax=Polychaeton citri CBS 116435 TaxID=1314669 RepID=A0A9P4QAH4_9PEZI|nr:hypothetical protein K431DRAFT_73437 [Polychaeton citri CBS 116435]